ncbi:MAG: phage tail tape measure protein [Bacilli bacterium]|nr:phage tail tape measure protein [Bacilli bacterium]
MAKQLNIDLSVRADTSQAKQQFQELQHSLSNLTKSAATSNQSLGLTKELSTAISKTVELESILKECATASGGLDLQKFSQKIPAESLKDYARYLQALGPEGERTFSKLAGAIARAEIPLKQSSTLLNNFTTALKNTARWQISSSILHGFMGSLQSAYRYAQDLNESLNNIRIVTGYSSEEMAVFASNANKAAQALSTTTTQYTDAALIYYQQGIRDQEEIAGRTETTIKLANVSRQSAQEVSDEMTAIWNNFYDGSQSLEYYADVITALGAATASSSQEISTGLEKFAAVSKTVGLSYEYATAALATITATTRQSADTVGTGLRTLFSRLEGLKLGETLEDGVDLNKYSQALESVGVQVLDVSGELRNMDDILDDLGERWGELSQAQKMALAQTVGGVRQYTNLIALMDNWDFMEQNLGVASGAEGTLQEQADIYAESWEAARDRVRAAAEDIYAKLLDDDLFIALTNGFAKFITTISHAIDAMGGLPGTLSLIASLMFKIFGNDMAASIDRIFNNIKLRSQGTLDEMLARRRQALDQVKNMYRDSADPMGVVKADVYGQQAELEDILLTKTQELLQKNTQLTAEEQKQANQLIQIHSMIGENVLKTAEAVKAQEKVVEGLIREMSVRHTLNTKNKPGAIMYPKSELQEDLTNLKQYTAARDHALDIQGRVQQTINNGGSFNSIRESLLRLQQEATDAGIPLQGLERIFQDLATNAQNPITSIEELRNALQTCVEDNGAQLENHLLNMSQRLQNAGWGAEEAKQALLDLTSAMSNGNQLTVEQVALLESLGLSYDEATGKILKMKGALPTLGQGLTSLGQTLMSVSMAINTIKGLIDTWNNEDMSFGEKLLASFTSLAMVLPMLISGLSMANLQNLATVSSSIAAALGFNTEAIAAVAAGESTAAFGTVLWTVLWPIGLVVAAITALVVIIHALAEAAHAASAEGKLEAAQEEAKAMSDALNEAKTKAQELHSAFDEYESIVDKLNKCTKGTQEWRDALEEANQKTTELLQKYPELLKEENLFDENGILNPEVLEKAVQKADNAQNALAAANIMAQAKVNSAQLEVDKQQFAKGNERYEIQGPKGETYIDYTKVNEDLQKLLEQYPALGSSALELSDAYAVLGIDMANATAEDQKLANSLLELANASIQAGTAVDNATKSIINDWAEANNVELEEGQAEIMGQAYEAEYDRIKKMIIDADASANSKASKSDNSSLDEFEGKSVWELYNEAMGTNYRLSSNGIQGNDDNRTYEYIDDEHNKHTVTIDEIADIIAASQALEGMGTAAEDAQKALANMAENVGEDIASGLQKWIATGNFESMTQEDFQKMTAGMDKDNEGNYEKEDVEAYLQQALGTDDVASILGEDWYENFNSAAVDFETAIGSITDHLSESAKTIYEGITDVDKLSLGAQQSVAKMIQDTFNAQGSEVASALGEKINSVLSDDKISDEDKEKFISTLNSIDWDTASIGDFKTALENAGVDLSDFGLDAEELFAMLSTAGSASLETLRDQWKEVQSIIKGLKTGDTISDEDYQKLVDQYGTEAMDVYFETMADGTHRLIQDADDFYAHITNASRQAMLSNMTEARDVNTTLQGSSADELNSGKIDDTDTALAAMTYLDTLDLEEEKLNQLAEAREHYNQTGEFTKEDLQLINELMQENKITAEDYENMMQQTMDTIKQNAEAYLSTATSVAELDALDAQLRAQGIDAANEYAEALIGLAGQYENTAEEIEKYQLALQSGNAEQIEAAQDALKAATKLGEAAEKYDLNARSLEAQAKEIAEAEGVTAEQAAHMAVANQRLNKGITQLNKNWKNWKKTLTSTDKTSQDYADTLVELSDSVGEIVGWYKELNLDSKFVEKNMGLIEKAAEGDTTAILELGAAVAQAEIAESELNTTMAEGAMSDGGENAFQQWSNDALDAQQNFENLKNSLGGMFQTIQENMSALEGGASLQDILGGPGGVEAFVQQLNAYAAATGMTADQMQSMLSSIGVTANVQTDYQEQDVKVPTYDEYSEIDVAGSETLSGMTSDGKPLTSTVPVWHKRTWTVMGPPIETKGYVEVASIAMEDNNGNPTPPVFSGRKAPAPSSTGGGGGGGGGRGRRGRRGSSRRPADKKAQVAIDEKEYKKEDKEIERYHEIKNTLETIGFNLDKIAQKKDKAFGKAKIQAIREETKELEKQIAAQKQYIKEIEGYYTSDKQALMAWGATFNEDGNIDNYDELMKKHIDESNADYEKFIKEQNDAVKTINSSKRD